MSHDKIHKCCICGKDFMGRSNNAAPYKAGICCDLCNVMFVIPARFGELTEKPKKNVKKK